MTACWKQLSHQADVQLRVIAWETSAAIDQASFDTTKMDSIAGRLLSVNERSETKIIEEEIENFRPDIIVIPGWVSSAYTKCVLRLSKTRPRVVMGMDTPWKGNVRQQFTRWRLNRLFQKVDHVVVAGERTWQYARHLGFSEARISRGVYGWDSACFGEPTHLPRNQPSSRSFVFVGRFAEEKGIGTLLSAYKRYRESVSSPWPLTMCGSGPLCGTVSGEGVINAGFIQPADLPSIFRQSSVFVLPSHYEPWGVALAEAMGAGLPVIASEACGAAIDLVRPYWNGLLVPTASVESLTSGFVWFHNNEDRIVPMGANAQQTAEPFSAKNWGIRWKAVLDGVVESRAA